MTTYTFGIGKDRAPQDLFDLLPEEVRRTDRCTVVDVRRSTVSRNRWWSWGYFWGEAQTWCNPICRPQLANRYDAPLGAWIPYYGEDQAHLGLRSLADWLAASNLRGPSCIVLVCQCREAVTRYKRGPKTGQIKTLCHRVIVAESLAVEVYAVCGEKPDVRHL